MAASRDRLRDESRRTLSRGAEGKKKKKTNAAAADSEVVPSSSLSSSSRGMAAGTTQSSRKKEEPSKEGDDDDAEADQLDQADAALNLAQGTSDDLCYEAVRAVKALALAEPLRAPLVARALRYLLCIAIDAHHPLKHLRALAEAALVTLGFEGGARDLQLCGNDAKLLEEWFAMRRALGLQDALQAEYVQALEDAWPPPASTTLPNKTTTSSRGGQGDPGDDCAPGVVLVDDVEATQQQQQQQQQRGSAHDEEDDDLEDDDDDPRRVLSAQRKSRRIASESAIWGGGRGDMEREGFFADAWRGTVRRIFRPALFRCTSADTGSGDEVYAARHQRPNRVAATFGEAGEAVVQQTATTTRRVTPLVRYDASRNATRVVEDGALARFGDSFDEDGDDADAVDRPQLLRQFSDTNNAKQQQQSQQQSQTPDKASASQSQSYSQSGGSSSLSKSAGSGKQRGAGKSSPRTEASSSEMMTTTMATSTTIPLPTTPPLQVPSRPSHRRTGSGGGKTPIGRPKLQRRGFASSSSETASSAPADAHGVVDDEFFSHSVVLAARELHHWWATARCIAAAECDDGLNDDLNDDDDDDDDPVAKKMKANMRALRAPPPPPQKTKLRRGVSVLTKAFKTDCPHSLYPSTERTAAEVEQARTAADDGAMPERLKKSLREHFPSQLQRRAVAPLHRVPGGSVSWSPRCSRVLLMPARQYFSFRREGRVVQRVIEASDADFEGRRWGLVFRDAAFAGEFRDSLRSCLAKNPSIESVSFVWSKTYAFGGAGAAAGGGGRGLGGGPSGGGGGGLFGGGSQGGLDDYDHPVSGLFGGRSSSSGGGGSSGGSYSTELTNVVNDLPRTVSAVTLDRALKKDALQFLGYLLRLAEEKRVFAVRDFLRDEQQRLFDDHHHQGQGHHSGGGGQTSSSAENTPTTTLGNKKKKHNATNKKLSEAVPVPVPLAGPLLSLLAIKNHDHLSFNQGDWNTLFEYLRKCEATPPLPAPYDASFSRCLRWLDLSGNRLQDKGVGVVLAQLARPDSSVTALDLSDNNVGAWAHATMTELCGERDVATEYHLQTQMGESSSSSSGGGAIGGGGSSGGSIGDNNNTNNNNNPCGSGGGGGLSAAENNAGGVNVNVSAQGGFPQLCKLKRPGVLFCGSKLRWLSLAKNGIGPRAATRLLNAMVDSAAGDSSGGAAGTTNSSSGDRGSSFSSGGGIGAGENSCPRSSLRGLSLEGSNLGPPCAIGALATLGQCLRALAEAPGRLEELDLNRCNLQQGCAHELLLGLIKARVSRTRSTTTNHDDTERGADDDEFDPHESEDDDDEPGGLLFPPAPSLLSASSSSVNSSHQGVVVVAAAGESPRDAHAPSRRGSSSRQATINSDLSGSFASTVGAEDDWVVQSAGQPPEGGGGATTTTPATTPGGRRRRRSDREPLGFLRDEEDDPELSRFYQSQIPEAFGGRAVDHDDDGSDDDHTATDQRGLSRLSFVRLAAGNNVSTADVDDIRDELRRNRVRRVHRAALRRHSLRRASLGARRPATPTPAVEAVHAETKDDGEPQMAIARVVEDDTPVASVVVGDSNASASRRRRRRHRDERQRRGTKKSSSQTIDDDDGDFDDDDHRRDDDDEGSSESSGIDDDDYDDDDDRGGADGGTDYGVAESKGNGRRRRRTFGERRTASWPMGGLTEEEVRERRRRRGGRGRGLAETTPDRAPPPPEVSEVQSSTADEKDTSFRQRPRGTVPRGGVQSGSHHRGPAAGPSFSGGGGGGRQHHRRRSSEETYSVCGLFSAPLAYQDGRTRLVNGIEALDFEAERARIAQGFEKARFYRQAVRVRFDVLTMERLRTYVTLGKCDVLHIAGHGHKNALTFEDGRGGLQFVAPEGVARLVNAGGQHRPSLAFVCACHSELTARAFERAGVPHVVAVDLDTALLDAAALEFTQAFYLALAAGQTVANAFNLGAEAVANSPHVEGGLSGGGGGAGGRNNNNNAQTGASAMAFARPKNPPPPAAAGGSTSSSSGQQQQTPAAATAAALVAAANASSATRNRPRSSSVTDGATTTTTSSARVHSNRFKLFPTLESDEDPRHDVSIFPLLAEEQRRQDPARNYRPLPAPSWPPLFDDDLGGLAPTPSPFRRRYGAALPSPPPPPEDFLGREVETYHVVESLTRRRRLVSVVGRGGAGKSALVAAVTQYAAERRFFPDGVLFLRLDESLATYEDLEAALKDVMVAARDKLQLRRSKNRPGHYGGSGKGGASSSSSQKGDDNNANNTNGTKATAENGVTPQQQQQQVVGVTTDAELFAAELDLELGSLEDGASPFEILAHAHCLVVVEGFEFIDQGDRSLLLKEFQECPKVSVLSSSREPLTRRPSPSAVGSDENSRSSAAAALARGVVETVVRIGPLSLKAAARLFARQCPQLHTTNHRRLFIAQVATHHLDVSSKKLHAAVAKLEEREPRLLGNAHSVLSSRERRVLEALGDGFPGDIVARAFDATYDGLQDLVAIAVPTDDDDAADADQIRRAQHRINDLDKATEERRRQALLLAAAAATTTKKKNTDDDDDDDNAKHHA